MSMSVIKKLISSAPWLMGKLISFIPYGSRPFARKNYINKFLTLTKNILSKKESGRFLKTVQNLTKLKSGQLNKLNIEIKSSNLKKNNKKGIF